ILCCFFADRILFQIIISTDNSALAVDDTKTCYFIRINFTNNILHLLLQCQFIIFGPFLIKCLLQVIIDDFHTITDRTFEALNKLCFQFSDKIRPDDLKRDEQEQNKNDDEFNLDGTEKTCFWHSTYSCSGL